MEGSGKGDIAYFSDDMSEHSQELHIGSISIWGRQREDTTRSLTATSKLRGLVLSANKDAGTPEVGKRKLHLVLFGNSLRTKQRPNQLSLAQFQASQCRIH